MQTRITKLFGIQHPIILSPMALVARADLVSAVCRAGGLGLFGPPGLTVAQMRQQIREIKERNAGKPFGVNIMVNMPKVKELIQILLEEAVPVWVSSFRNPFKFLNIKKPDNVLYIPAVGNVHQAVSVEKHGADAVIVQSWESGGHPGLIASSVLIPEVSQAVKIPVIAAGGFADGRGLAAALALGAEGIAMGTRFAVTQESPLPQSLKEMYLKAGDIDAILNAAWDGIPARAITKMKRYYGWWSHPWDAIPNLINNKNDFNAGWKEIFENTRFIREMGGSPVQFATGLSMFRKAALTGELKGKSYSPCGQVVGLINDIPPCSEVIERTVAGAEAIIKNLNNRLQKEKLV
jgi:NAD(P)H-dependent flavin oxidoreductase YrpB (nitropropane dioxygenase family)